MLFAFKGVDFESTCTKSAKSFCIESIYAHNISAKNTNAENTFSAVSVCIKNASPNSTSTNGANKKNAYGRDDYAVKYLRINLQSSLILQIKLFKID